MVNILRRYKEPLLLVMTLFTVISFTWWGPGQYDQSRKNAHVMVIRGKPVTIEAWQREERRMQVHARMGSAYAMALDPGARFGKTSRAGVENSLLFEGEADALGIVATDEEIQRQLDEVPAFMGVDRRFDPAQYERFVETVLQPEGFNKAQIETFLSGDVRVMKVARLLGSTAPATPIEVKQRFLRERLTTEASYVVVKSEGLRKEQKVTEEEIKKRYEDKKDFLKTPEQRKVRFAAFTLPPAVEAKPADGRPPEDPKRTEQLQQFANAAYDLTAALVQPGADFDALAKKAGATIGETAAFFGRDSGPAEIEGSVKAAELAFELTKEKPHSRHLSLLKGTYVLALKEIKPPDQLTLEQARKQIEDELLDEKTDSAMRAKADALRGRLLEARKAGKSFSEAAQSVGLSAEPFPAFSAMQPPPPGAQYGNIIPVTARKLAPGEISEPIVSPGAALIVHVDQRPAVDEKGMDEAKARIVAGIEGNRMGMAFEAWLAERRQAAGLKDNPGP